MDDLLIASNSIKALHQVTHKLQQAFPVKDLAFMEYCIGIKVSHNQIEGTLLVSHARMQANTDSNDGPMQALY